MGDAGGGAVNGRGCEPLASAPGGGGEGKVVRGMGLLLPAAEGRAGGASPPGAPHVRGPAQRECAGIPAVVYGAVSAS